MSEPEKTEVTPTARSLAKANRRQALLDAAAQLFAQRGFNGVSIEELGAAAGISGPAVYRHFDGKQEVLSALLTEVSEFLLNHGRKVLEETPDRALALRNLISFHVDFALSRPDIIRVQDRDLAHLHHENRQNVRALQRDYLQLWIDALGQLRPTTEAAELRLRAHAAFGLINSTPHSLRGTGGKPRPTPEGRNSMGSLAPDSARLVLEQMTTAALLS